MTRTDDDAPRPTHYILRGGLDYISSPLTIDPGRLWRALNVEPAEAGYRRIAGYERFDGRPSPSDAAYWILGRGDLVTNQTDPDVGDTITGGTSAATGVLLEIVGNEYVLGEVSGAFQSGEDLEDAGTAFSTASGVVRKFGAAMIADDLDYRDSGGDRRGATTSPWCRAPDLSAAYGATRATCSPCVTTRPTPPTAGVMHRATPSGWTAVAGVTLPAGGTLPCSSITTSWGRRRPARCSA